MADLAAEYIPDPADVCHEGDLGGDAGEICRYCRREITELREGSICPTRVTVLAERCGVTYTAVAKWFKLGSVPRASRKGRRS